MTTITIDSFPAFKIQLGGDNMKRLFESLRADGCEVSYDSKQRGLIVNKYKNLVITGPTDKLDVLRDLIKKSAGSRLTVVEQVEA